MFIVSGILQLCCTHVELLVFPLLKPPSWISDFRLHHTVWGIAFLNLSTLKTWELFLEFCSYVIYRLRYFQFMRGHFGFLNFGFLTFYYYYYYYLFNATVSLKNESQAEDHVRKAQPKAGLKKCVSSLRLKVFRSSQVRMSRGRLFQISGAADENLRPASAVFVCEV